MSSLRLLPAVSAAAAFVPSATQDRSIRHLSFVAPPRLGLVVGPTGMTQQYRIPLPATSATRLYHSSPLRNRNRNKDDDDEGILAKAKKKAKNTAKRFLPTRWFQSEEEKRAADKRKLVKDSVKNNLQQVFKDAPLPLRVLGGVIAPLLGGLLSNLAETAASQQELVDTVYQQAVSCITADSAIAEALGEPVSVGVPFSQSSSSSSFNGETSTRVELAFPVTGSFMQGVGRLVSAGNDKNPTLQLLEVQISGRVFPVSTTPSRKKKATKFSSFKDDNIIEAEIIEKHTKKS